MTSDEPGRWTKSTVYADMWVDPADDPRETGVAYVDERTTLRDFLHRYRRTLELKCADLDAAQLASRSVPPSTMSLLGLVRHLAEVERGWFRRRLAGADAPYLYGPGEEAWDGASADPAVVADAWAAWRAEVDFAERLVDAAPDLGPTGPTGLPLRQVLVHMIEEYARHCGHADLLRERIDGRIGQ
ncbi:hypothetical protein Val02_71710 [Virgisporangium aliadipatigenens]|uniref:DinB family protein n=1 Tax=Virgisporangium aliadipatigenens TaxID=741659 RepID=A0A8J3YUX2_9ACTN|nr:DinB family protein [Virgisporangium aliadipatigenens]GIJ50285.1 hypothetical protein Val02_71710 [Virgisporangium aliadipatigenens]